MNLNYYNFKFQIVLSRFILILYLTCFFICNSLKSQEHLSEQVPHKEKQVKLNSKTVYMDSRGKKISFETFLDWTSGDDYIIDPFFDEKGNMMAMYVIVPDMKNGGEAANAHMGPTIVDLENPGFVAQDLSGKLWKSADLKGKIVILNFWFASCKPCINEIPNLNQLYDDLKSENVVFIAPTFESKSRTIAFKEKYPFKYSLIPNGRKITNDFGVIGYPTHMIIGKKGRIKAVINGSHKINDKIKEIVSILKME